VIRWIALIPLIVLGALAILFAGFGLHHDPHVYPAALVGKPLPDRTLPPLAGGAPVSLRAAVRGPTFINVFASWCAPCAEEAPALAALKSEGGRIVGVANKDDPEHTQAFLQRYGDPFAVVLSDRDGSVGVDLGISGYPETFLVSPAGKVVAKHIGPLEPRDVEDLLQKAQALR
jgi:cytochrome c biogenesis protein CcmG/thiol:disulfide interchange protein DsbE